MRNTLGLLLIALMTAGCMTKEKTAPDPADAVLNSIPRDRWPQLASRRVFFAHKSVGLNVVQGIEELGQEDSRVRVRVVESRDARDLESPGFAHAQNGVNGDPLGKIAAFRSALDNGLGNKLDVALMKFCYVDFFTNEHVPAVFEEYRRTMAAVEAAYPHLTIVHMTVPLTVLQTGPKAWVKRLIGRPVYGANENIARTEFNELIRREYTGKEPLFDIASLEATKVDGSRNQFDKGGRKYDELATEYSSDGGHLNEGGRHWIAAHLLAFLASLPARPVPTSDSTRNTNDLGKKGEESLLAHHAASQGHD
jgi:hypothetical protein